MTRRYRLRWALRAALRQPRWYFGVYRPRVRSFTNGKRGRQPHWLYAARRRHAQAKAERP